MNHALVVPIGVTARQSATCAARNVSPGWHTTPHPPTAPPLAKRCIFTIIYGNTFIMDLFRETTSGLLAQKQSACQAVAGTKGFGTLGTCLWAGQDEGFWDIGDLSLGCQDEGFWDAGDLSLGWPGQNLPVPHQGTSS